MAAPKKQPDVGALIDQMKESDDIGHILERCREDWVKIDPTLRDEINSYYSTDPPLTPEDRTVDGLCNRLARIQSYQDRVGAVAAHYRQVRGALASFEDLSTEFFLRVPLWTELRVADQTAIKNSLLAPLTNAIREVDGLLTDCHEVGKNLTSADFKLKEMGRITHPTQHQNQAPWVASQGAPPRP